MNPFRYLDYRTVISKLLEEKRKENPRLTQEFLSEKTGIQKTYLSKVLNGSAHLHSDQLYEIISFFELDTALADYLYLLLEFGRTGNAKRKRDLQRRIGAIQLENRNLNKQVARRISSPGASGAELEYFLDPICRIVHQFLSIKKFQNEASLITKNLGISESHLQSVLERLKQSGMVQHDPHAKTWVAVNNTFHLDKKSVICAPHLQLSRMFASQHLMKIPLEQRFSYSSTIRADESTKNFIHERILKLLREVDPVIDAAPEQAVYELSFDLFPWSLE
jgi:uncharacterized protein (TIGR02147 family)